MRPRSAVLAAALLALAAAPQDPAAPKPPARNVGGLEKDGAGTITGIVKFAGKQPRRAKIDMSASAYCLQACGSEPPLEENWVFGRNGQDVTLQNVLVYVSKGLEGRTFDPPSKPAILDQAGCLYTPHVVAVMAGQTLQIRNSDATLHNVNTRPLKNRGFNTGMPSKGDRFDQVFSVPERKILLECNMHPWMKAYVHVLEHPFFAITEEDGTFTLKGLPPGEYEVAVLHESARLEPTPAAAALKVEAGLPQKIEFTYRSKRDE
jgi:hypothetical protein